MIAQYGSDQKEAIYRHYMTHYSLAYKSAAPYRGLRFYGGSARYGSFAARNGDGVFNSEHAGMVSRVDFVCAHLESDLSRLLRVD